MRRRRRSLVVAHVGAALAGAALIAGLALAFDAQPSGGSGSVESAGQELYLTGCASCHGAEGEGTERGPSLEDAGTASAYYYLETGRMPMADNDSQPQRKPPAYEPEAIARLVAYVGTLGDGPDLDEIAVEWSDADLAAGGTLYRANCAPCHSAAGIGGALNEGRLAPSVELADPLVVTAAVRVGPGQMPVFGSEALSDDDLADVVRYTQYLRDQPSPGGAALGGAGPIPEGAVAWLFGFGVMAAATWWIGSRERAG